MAIALLFFVLAEERIVIVENAGVFELGRLSIPRAGDNLSLALSLHCLLLL